MTFPSTSQHGLLWNISRPLYGPKVVHTEKTPVQISWAFFLSRNLVWMLGVEGLPIQYLSRVPRTGPYDF